MSGTASVWSKPLAAVRYVQTRGGDTLERVALRELGSAARWYDLANLNGLSWPYLTDDPTVAAPPAILQTGSTIKVPSAAPPPSAVADPNSIFGTDIALTNGFLTADSKGRLATVSGVPNLKQALENRLSSHPGDLVYYPNYGCRVYRLLGQPGRPAVEVLAASWVASAVASDARVQEARNVVATLTADTLLITCEAVAVDGQVIPVSQTILPPGTYQSGVPSYVPPPPILPPPIIVPVPPQMPAYLPEGFGPAVGAGSAILSTAVSLVGVGAAAAGEASTLASPARATFAAAVGATAAALGTLSTAIGLVGTGASAAGEVSTIGTGAPQSASFTSASAAGGSSAAALSTAIRMLGASAAAGGGIATFFATGAGLVSAAPAAAGGQANLQTTVLLKALATASAVGTATVTSASGGGSGGASVGYITLDGGGKILIDGGTGAITQDAPPVAPATYITLEDGSKILLDDGSGALEEP